MQISVNNSEPNTYRTHEEEENFDMLAQGLGICGGVYVSAIAFGGMVVEFSERVGKLGASPSIAVMASVAGVPVLLGLTVGAGVVGYGLTYSSCHLADRLCRVVSVGAGFVAHVLIYKPCHLAIRLCRGACVAAGSVTCALIHKSCHLADRLRGTFFARQHHNIYEA